MISVVSTWWWVMMVGASVGVGASVRVRVRVRVGATGSAGEAGRPKLSKCKGCLHKATTSIGNCSIIVHYASLSFRLILNHGMV
jgi:hypothetical protein